MSGLSNVHSDTVPSTFSMQQINCYMVEIGRAILQLSQDISRLDFYQMGLQISSVSQMLQIYESQGNKLQIIISDITNFCEYFRIFGF